MPNVLFTFYPTFPMHFKGQIHPPQIHPPETNGSECGSRRRQEGFFLLEARLPEGASGVANRLGFGIAFGVHKKGKCKHSIK